MLPDIKASRLQSAMEALFDTPIDLKTVWSMVVNPDEAGCDAYGGGLWTDDPDAIRTFAGAITDIPADKIVRIEVVAARAPGGVPVLACTVTTVTDLMVPGGTHVRGCAPGYGMATEQLVAKVLLDQ